MSEEKREGRRAGAGAWSAAGAVLLIAALVLWRMGHAQPAMATWESSLGADWLTLPKAQPVGWLDGEALYDVENGEEFFSKDERVLVGRAKEGWFVFQAKNSEKNFGPNGEIYFYTPVSVLHGVRQSSPTAYLRLTTTTPE